MENNKEEFDQAMTKFTQEDTTTFQSLLKNHSWLTRHYPTSFLPQFHATGVK